MPKVVVKGDTGSLNYEFDEEICFQTEDTFQPVQTARCAHIDYLKQDTKEDCPWHKSRRTAGVRADREKRAREDEKRRADKANATVRRALKELFRAVCF